jgi:hypothetical protein
VIYLELKTRALQKTKRVQEMILLAVLEMVVVGGCEMVVVVE